MLATGQTLVGRRGAYVLEHEHGRGGFGVTYRARREVDSLPVIVKVLRFDRVSDWKAVQLFQREADVLRSLTHPCIPAYIDDFPSGDDAALVQEFIEGETLATAMQAGRRMDEAGMLLWFTEVLRVLEYLHRLSPPVIHRDVTPKNIVLRPDGRPALVDFGSVQAALRSAHSVASTTAGTFGYAPPEQFVGRVGPASDLYGLAMTFLAVWSGLSPEQMPLDGARVDVPAFLKADPRLVRLLVEMTESDPRKRLSDATSVLQRVANIAGRTPAADSLAPQAPAGAPSRVTDVDTYLALLRARLRDEGYTVLGGSVLGDVRVKLVAHRRGEYVYVAREHDLQTAEPGDGLRAFARLTYRAHASSRTAWRSLLSGRITIFPIVVSEAAGADAAQRLQSIEGRTTTALPALVDVSEGAVHLARVSHGELSAYLPYYWWLAAPRLLDKPRVRPPSATLRILLAVALGALLMFGGATLYGLSQSISVFNALMVAADPNSHALIVKTYTFGKEREKTVNTVLLTSSGAELAIQQLPADGWLCGFAQDDIVYTTTDDTVWSASARTGGPHQLTRLPLGQGHCAIHSSRIAFDLGRPRRVYIQRIGSSEAELVPGTVLGDSHPAWFPGGDRLAVAAGPDGARNIVVIDLATGNREVITPPTDGSSHRDDVFPSVSPDGARILFSRIGRLATGDQSKFNRSTERVGDMYVVELAAKQPQLLIQDTCGIGPKAWLSTGEVAFTKWTGEQEGCGPYVYDLRTTDMRRLPDYEAY